MATVFFMKFNREQGALVADEMTWHLSFKYGYRPSRYGDSILNLLDENFVTRNDFAAVYAGVGFPSLHFEVAREARKMLAENPEAVGDLDRTGEIVENIYQEAHARMINDRLRFNFGFDRDQLNQGKFQFLGKDYEIKQEAVISEARKILKYGDKQEAYQRIFDNEGALMGYDRENGIRAYHIGNEGRGLDFAYPFDAIGPGKELGTRIFGDTSSRMQLDERRTGFSCSDGLFLLLNAFVESYDFSVKVGGYSQLFIIDAKREFFPNVIREYSSHNMHLAGEIVRAYRWGYLPREKAQNMLEQLILHNQDWESIEEQMFGEAANPDELRKYLMGYKPASVPNMPLK